MKRIVLMLSVVLVLLIAVSATADTINFDLNVPNTALSIFTGPYAKVTVNWTNSTHATITFDSYTGGAVIYLLGDGSSAAVNVNGTFTLDTQSGTNSFAGFTPGAFTDAGSENVSDFGTFNQTIRDHDGFNNTATEIILNLIASGSTSWASASDVLVANGEGFTAAAHIFPWGGAYDTNNKPINNFGTDTGFAGNGTPIPEPATMLLLGSGLIGLAGFARKRFRKD